MSLIANLLKKVQPGNDVVKDVPPGLQRIVLESPGSRKSSGSGRRLGVIAGSAVLLGVISLFAMDYMQKQSMKAKREASARKAAQLQQAKPLQQPPAEVVQISKAVEQPAVSVHKAQDETPDTSGNTEKTSRLIHRADNRSGQKNRKNPSLQAHVPKTPLLAGNTVKLTDNTVRENQQLPVKSEVPPPKQSKKQQLGRDEIADRDSYVYSARSYENQGSYYLALENYKKALRIDPENHVILANAAGVLIRTGAYSEARNYLKHSLDIKKDYLPALVNLGIAAIKSGQPSEGEGYLTGVLAQEPSNRHALLNMAILREKEKNYRSAADYYKKLSTAGETQGYLGLARISEMEGRTDEAVAYYRQALSKGDIGAEQARDLNQRIVRLER